MRQNVIPYLCVTPFPRDRIAREIAEFAGDKPEFWAYYADYDWVALCQLFGTMMQLPKGWPMYCRDLKQAVDAAGNPRLPKQGGKEHHALHDAIWTRDAWNWLCDRKQGGQADSLPESLGEHIKSSGGDGVREALPPMSAREEALTAALKEARADLFSWCVEGSGSQPTLDTIDAALAGVPRQEARSARNAAREEAARHHHSEGRGVPRQEAL